MPAQSPSRRSDACAGWHGLVAAVAAAAGRRNDLKNTPAPGTGATPAIQGCDARVTQKARHLLGVLPLSVGDHQAVLELAPKLLVSNLLVSGYLVQCNGELLLGVLCKPRGYGLGQICGWVRITVGKDTPERKLRLKEWCDAFL